MSKESYPTSQHENNSVSSQNVRKRDKIFNLFRSSSTNPKVMQPQSTMPTRHHLSTVSAEDRVAMDHAVSTTEIKSLISNVQSSALSAKSHSEIFSQNVNPPVVLINLPEFGSRIDNTPQLALCIGLLPKSCDLISQEDYPSQFLSSGATAKLAWIKALKQDLVEQERLRW
ncbi:hypothetical protein BGZ89_006684, partial [Linnemannia elongata]